MSATQEPASDVVSWPITTGSTVAPLRGSMQNTAPFSTSSRAVSVQSSQSMPTELSVPPPSPSVIPTVSHESYCAVVSYAQNLQ